MSTAFDAPDFPVCLKIAVAIFCLAQHTLAETYYIGISGNRLESVVVGEEQTVAS